MRTGMIVLRAVFIGLAMIFGIFWLVWMFDINAYTKLQILRGPVDMTVIRRALGGAVVLCLCGFTATLHVMKRRFRMALIAAIIVVYAAVVLAVSLAALKPEYFTFQNGSRELVVLEEHRENRYQAVFYERKSPAIVEYLGNMDYYGDRSVFETGDCNIVWQDNGQVIVKVRAQFAGTNEDSKAASELSEAKNTDVFWNRSNMPEGRETKEQIFYVEGQ